MTHGKAELLIHFELVIQPKKSLKFASLKAVKCLFSFITQFIPQSMFWFILATVRSQLSYRIVNWYYGWFTSDSFLNLLIQCTILCVFQLFFFNFVLHKLNCDGEKWILFEQIHFERFHQKPSLEVSWSWISRIITVTICRKSILYVHDKIFFHINLKII